MLISIQFSMSGWDPILSPPTARGFETTSRSMPVWDAQQARAVALAHLAIQCASFTDHIRVSFGKKKVGSNFGFR